MKKLNFINWLRKQTYTDVTKKSLIDKHVGKVQRYVNPTNLIAGDTKDINVARIATSIQKLPHEERLERQQQILNLQNNLINSEQK